jgi:hypothetical protein
VTNLVKLVLPPVSDDAGALGRLANLGYPSTDDKDRGFAILSFQQDHGLEQTLKLDGPTRQKLTELHGS